MAEKRLLAGRYEVRSLIGRGGMAEVHLGYDTRLSRAIAIKMLRTDLAQDAVFQTRFRREAQASASLNHPNIVGVHDTGEEQRTLPDGTTVSVPYIIMEYVEGNTVRQLLSNGQPVPIAEAVEITTGVLNALEYSHHRNLVHRDIKPGNVMLTNDGKVKVMDFGIARALEDSGATMTSTDAVVGTAQYLSPEQAKGENVDQRSDLYSTGCLLFELLTGRPPFKGDSAVAVAYQHVSEIPPTPSSITPDVSDAMDRVVMKSLAKKREERYHTAKQFRDDLHAALIGGQISAPTMAVMQQNYQPIPQPVSATTTLPPMTTHVAQPDPYAQQQLRARRAAQKKRQEELARKAKAQKQRRILIGTLVSLLVLLVAAGTFIGLYVYNKETETVAIPKGIVGMSESEARQTLGDLGFNVVFGSAKASDTVQAGMVVTTNPKPGAALPPGSKVTVYLSSGPAEVKVPDVTGLSQERARALLEEKGLRVGNVTTEDSPDQNADHVLRTNPAAGTSTTRGNNIDMVLASGYVNIDTSKVVGKKKDEALAYLHKLGLSTNTQAEMTDKHPEGTVISINPTGKVKSGSQISVTVAAKPTPPSPSPSPSTSTPAEPPQPGDN